MGSLFSSVQPHRGFSAVLTSFLLYEITANLCLCVFPSQMCFLLDPKQSKHGIYQKVPRNCINCLIGAYLTASSLQLRPASLLLDRTPLWLHQLLFSDKHPQHPSWNPPTPPSILLPFTCFASWQNTVKWKHLLFPSLRGKQVRRGEVSDFPVFVSACPDNSRSRHTHVRICKPCKPLRMSAKLPAATVSSSVPRVLTLGEIDSKISWGRLQDAISFSTLQGVWSKHLDWKPLGTKSPDCTKYKINNLAFNPIVYWSLFGNF